MFLGPCFLLRPAMQSERLLNVTWDCLWGFLRVGRRWLKLKTKEVAHETNHHTLQLLFKALREVHQHTRVVSQSVALAQRCRKQPVAVNLQVLFCFPLLVLGMLKIASDYQATSKQTTPMLVDQNLPPWLVCLRWLSMFGLTKLYWKAFWDYVLFFIGVSQTNRGTSMVTSWSSATNVALWMSCGVWIKRSSREFGGCLGAYCWSQ